jgi:hypothetical protein
VKGTSGVFGPKSSPPLWTWFVENPRRITFRLATLNPELQNVCGDTGTPPDFLIAGDVDRRRPPLAIVLLSIFFAAGALVCIVVMLALAFPGSAFEIIWKLKPEVRDDFLQLGDWSVALMALVGAACGLAAFGLARMAEWGRRVAVCILTVNLIGDMVNAVFRHDPRTLIGLPIGGFLIWYLSKKKDDFQRRKRGALL